MVDIPYLVYCTAQGLPQSMAGYSTYPVVCDSQTVKSSQIRYRSVSSNTLKQYISTLISLAEQSISLRLPYRFKIVFNIYIAPEAPNVDFLQHIIILKLFWASVLSFSPYYPSIMKRSRTMMSILVL